MVGTVGALMMSKDVKLVIIKQPTPSKVTSYILGMPDELFELLGFWEVDSLESNQIP